MSTAKRGRGPGRGERVDAVRNRQRVVETAQVVLTERGPGVSMREIATRAGVAPGTIYRHFADKDALIAAVLENRFRFLTERTHEAIERLGPWPAFVRVMRLMAVMMTEDRALAGAVGAARRRSPGAGDPAHGSAMEARAEMDAALRTVAERAQAAGELRGDVGVVELGLVMGSVALSLDHADQRSGSPHPWEQFLQVALDGLRESSRGAAER